MKLLFILSIVCLTTFSSCFLNPNCKTGKGEIITQVRKTDAFDQVVVEGSCNVHILYDSIISVKVKDYQNIVDFMETNMIHNKLTISYKKFSCVTNSKSEVFITLPHLKSLSVEGSGDIDVSGKFKEKQISAVISGSGDIKFIKSDTINFLNAEINGSGNIIASEMPALSCQASINGSGDIRVNAIENLKANISGSGSILYKGKSQLDSKINGSGEIKADK